MGEEDKLNLQEGKPKPAKKKSRKLRCPEHGLILRLSPRYNPPEGVDPKTKRYTCALCNEYWYKMPKYERVMREDNEYWYKMPKYERVMREDEVQGKMEL